MVVISCGVSIRSCAAHAEEEALTTSTPSSKETGRQCVASRSPTISSHSSSTRPVLIPAFQPRFPSTFFSTSSMPCGSRGSGREPE